ncbi:MAG: hypothetical protein ACT4TC_22925 [Myxococcaceae bacterium]
MFSAWMALALTTQSPNLKIAPDRGCQVAAPSARFSPHFNKVSLEEIVQLIADVTCRSFILPEIVKGYGEVPGTSPLIDFERKRGPLASISHALRRETLRPENGGPGNPGERLITPSNASVEIAPGIRARPVPCRRIILAADFGAGRDL